MEDSHYGTLQDDISTIMQNIFGPQESDFLDDSDSSEDGDSGSSSDELEGPNPEIVDYFFTSQQFQYQQEIAKLKTY
jgi:hypothetical protein